MNRIFLFSLWLSSSFLMAQTVTGEITFMEDFSANITLDETNVTLTLTGDETRYLSVGFGVTSMTSGGDIVSYDASGFNDRQFGGIGVTPSTDTQDWTVVSNEVTAGLRTVVVTRSLVGSDASDYTFDPAAGSLDLVWAYGPSLNFQNHGDDRGATNISFVLGVEGQRVSKAVTVYPIPATNELNMVLQEVALQETSFTIFSASGKRVFTQEVTEPHTRIDISGLAQGMYFLKVSGTDGVLGTTFVKR